MTVYISIKISINILYLYIYIRPAHSVIHFQISWGVKPGLTFTQVRDEQYTARGVVRHKAGCFGGSGEGVAVATEDGWGKADVEQLTQITA